MISLLWRLNHSTKSRMRRGASTGLGEPVNHRAQPTALTCNYSTAVIRAHCQDPEWCLACEGDQEKVVREKEHVHLHCDHLPHRFLLFMALFHLPVGFLCFHRLIDWIPHPCSPQRSLSLILNHFHKRTGQSLYGWKQLSRNPLPVR